MRNYMEDRLREFSETVAFDAQKELENKVEQDLLQRLGSIPVEQHLEFVKVRGMLEGLRYLRHMRDEFLENTEE